MKAVFDTNVLVAAFVTEGVCSKLLWRGRKRRFHLMASPFILHEFENVLTKKFSATKKEAQEALKLLAEAAQTVVPPIGEVKGVCRDPSDDAILACGIAGGADYPVSGDADLLELREFKGMRILTPRDFELLFDD